LGSRWHAPIEPKQGSVSMQWNGTSKGGTA
jgi:hypothetical protein